MSKFFFYPSTNSWDEDIFVLTVPGIITIVVIIALLILLSLRLRKKDSGASAGKSLTKQLVFSGVAMALGLITSEFIPTISLPMGGSITIFSMLFIVLIGYMFGIKAGLMSGLAYGMLQFVIDPKFYSIPQLICDYPLAFGALGLSGLFHNKQHGLTLGYIAGVLGRYFFAFLSGWIFFGYYAPEGTPAVIYSLGYNLTYILPEAVLTLIVLQLPPVKNGLAQLKRMV